MQKIKLFTMKKTTYFLSLVFALFANTNNINAQTKIWGVGSGVGEADAQFSNAFVNSTTASGYSTTQWTALTVYESGGVVTPGNAYWVRNLTGVSQGGYATGMTALASPSAANGAALFDSDFMDNGGVVGAFGTGTSPSPHKGELISPRIDLTGYTNLPLAVKFYSYYRRFDITNYTISISTDDGASWVESVDIQVLQPVAVNADVEGAVTAIFNTATQGVANLTQCRIKFTFDGDYYYAFVDDITIEDILPNIPNIVISEIMFNPPEAGTDSLEFIEIYNNDAVAVDLTNYTLAGVTYTFPSVTLNPGEFYVVAVNASAFNNVFGSMPDGVFTGGLSNGGEFVTIKDASGNLVDSVRYFTSAPWPTDPNGQGPSLVLCDVNADNNDGNNWNASVIGTGVIINGKEVKASPGVANFCCSNTASTVNTSVCSGSNYTYADGTTVNNVTADVSYVSTIPNAGGCDSVVTENITVISIADQTVVATETVLCASNTGTTITTGSSETGFNYYLRDDSDDSVIDGPIAGTGSGLTFNTGTINSTTTYNVYAKEPNAVGLNGSIDRIEFSSPFSTYGNEITVEAWVNFTSTSFTNFPWAGQSTPNADNMTGNVWLWHPGTSATFYVNDNGSWRSLIFPTISSAGWHHVATVANSSGMFIYYDGVLVASNATGITSGIRNNASSYIELGQDPRYITDPARNSNAAFDNFAVWNVARSASDIANNYNNCLAGTESGLVQYTQMNESTGINLTSLVGANGIVFNGVAGNWIVGSGSCDVACDLEMSQTVTVTVLPALVGTDNTTICAEESVIINGTTYDAGNPTGTEVFTNVGANGCDSTVTVSLNVLPALVGTDNTTICATGSVVINGTTYDAGNPTGTEVFTNVGANGCDSTVTVSLNVLPALVGTDNTTICATGSVVINGTTYDAGNSTGTEVFTNVGANGCDSTVTVALNVLAAVDATVDNSLMPILSANQVGATYQWVDCDNGNAPISGEIGQTFTATVNGNYAVEVTVGGCTETSSCEAVTGVGVKEVANNTVSIYPNPTKWNGKH
jgi:hypothetical protein